MTMLIFPICNVYGHGLGLDKTSPINIDGKKISITVETSMYFTDSQDRLVTITANEDDTKQNAKNVTFLIGIYHEGKMLIRNYFFGSEGVVRINIHPTEANTITILGTQDSLLGAWHEKDGKPITIEGPLFTSAGLYSFEIEIRTIDDPKNIVENIGVFNADVSVIDTSTFSEKNNDGKNVDFQVKSYFDKLSDFEYNSSKKIITFEIPFDWDDQKINHIPVLHEEVHFPKNFTEFLSPGYTGQVNGIDLFKSSITIDDYSEENDRVVHFILLSDHLKFIKNALKKSNSDIPQKIVFTLTPNNEAQFPLIAMTKNEDVRVDLSWDPVNIEPSSNTKFIFTFRDGATGDTLRNTNYDFIIIQQGKEIYRTSGNAIVGGSVEEYTFSDDQVGPTIIRFEKIKDTDLQTEFGIVVVPEFNSLILFTLFFAMIFVLIFSRKISNYNLKPIT